MKLWIAAPLRLVECVGLGWFISFLAFAIPGGIYEAITGSPSDGFNFTLFLFGSPLMLIMLVVLPAMIWRSVNVKRACWWLLLFLLLLLAVMRLLH